MTTPRHGRGHRHRLPRLLRAGPNTLLLLTSVRNFTGPERDVFSIVIIHLISRRALAGFSLLCVSYYYNLTELVCYIYLVYNL